MNKINDFLDKRLKSTKKSSPKMELLAQQSASGNLSSFSGIFTTQELSEAERTHLQQLLEKYDHPTNTHLSSDLNNLSQITSEIKAINTQAIILHGERIQQVQKILKKYQEGAFTAWLITTYGNRQTPL